MRTNKFVRIGVIGLTVGTMFAAAAPAAMAKGGVSTRGNCSGAADWKLNLRPEDGGALKVQLEVEHAKPGQKWSIQMTDNGTKIFAGSKTANDLGRFKARAVTQDRAGSDSVKATATNTATGQVCNASATI